MTWAIIITVLVIGVVLSNLLLLKDSTKFDVPKDFKKNEEWDKEDKEKDDW